MNKNHEKCWKRERQVNYTIYNIYSLLAYSELYIYTTTLYIRSEFKCVLKKSKIHLLKRF